MSLTNLETILGELDRWERLSSAKNQPQDPLPDILEEYLNQVAATGLTHFPWSKIKPMLKTKMQSVIEEFQRTSPIEELPAVPNVATFSFRACKERVFDGLEAFHGIPFTIQRICELLTNPTKHYKRTDKYMRALESNFLVVSSIEPAIIPLGPPPPPLKPLARTASTTLLEITKLADEQESVESPANAGLTAEPEEFLANTEASPTPPNSAESLSKTESVEDPGDADTADPVKDNTNGKESSMTNAESSAQSTTKLEESTEPAPAPPPTNPETTESVVEESGGEPEPAETPIPEKTPVPSDAPFVDSDEASQQNKNME